MSLAKGPQLVRPGKLLAEPVTGLPTPPPSIAISPSPDTFELLSDFELDVNFIEPAAKPPSRSRTPPILYWDGVVPVGPPPLVPPPLPTSTISFQLLDHPIQPHSDAPAPHLAHIPSPPPPICGYVPLDFDLTPLPGCNSHSAGSAVTCASNTLKPKPSRREDARDARWDFLAPRLDDRVRVDPKHPKAQEKLQKRWRKDYCRDIDDFDEEADAFSWSRPVPRWQEMARDLGGLVDVSRPQQHRQ